MNKSVHKQRQPKLQKKKPVAKKQTRKLTTKSAPVQPKLSQSITKVVKASPFTLTRRTAVTELESPEDAAEFIQNNSNNKKLVAVDFYANWCGPCKTLAPAFSRMSDKYPNVQFAKVNCDEFNAPDIKDSFPPVNALPTVMFFVNNTHVDTVVGLNEAKIIANVEKYGAAV